MYGLAILRLPYSPPAVNRRHLNRAYVTLTVDIIAKQSLWRQYILNDTFQQSVIGGGVADIKQSPSKWCKNHAFLVTSQNI